MIKQQARRVITNYNTTFQKIEKRLRLWRRGSVFFGNDFVEFGSVEAIRYVLDTLIKEGILYKVGANLYCYPARQMPIIIGSKGAPTLAEIGTAIDSRNSYLRELAAKSDGCQ